MLKSKLKLLKEELRVWHKEEYEDMNAKTLKLVEDIADLRGWNVD